MATTKWIVFDFDGTIADSFEMSHRLLNSLAKRYHFKPVGDHEVDVMRRKTTLEFFAAIGVPLIMIPMLAIQAQRELRRHIDEIHPIPGIPEMLHAMRRAGYQLGILTSNATENVKQFLSAHGLLDCFDFVHSSRDAFGKDRRVKALIRKYRLEPDSLIYVGDMDADIHAARRAGIRVAAVSWGYQARELLERNRPDWLFDRPEQLIAAFCQGL